jgi:hypothetical protein
VAWIAYAAHATGREISHLNSYNPAVEHLYRKFFGQTLSVNQGPDLPVESLQGFYAASVAGEIEICRPDSAVGLGIVSLSHLGGDRYIVQDSDAGNSVLQIGREIRVVETGKVRDFDGNLIGRVSKLGNRLNYKGQAKPIPLFLAGDSVPGSAPVATISWLLTLIQWVRRLLGLPEATLDEIILRDAPVAESGLFGILYLLSVFLGQIILSSSGFDSEILSVFLTASLNPYALYLLMNLAFGLMHTSAYRFEAKSGEWFQEEVGLGERLRLAAVGMIIHAPYLLPNFSFMLAPVLGIASIQNHQRYNLWANS